MRDALLVRLWTVWRMRSCGWVVVVVDLDEVDVWSSYINVAEGVEEAVLLKVRDSTRWPH